MSGNFKLVDRETECLFPTGAQDYLPEDHLALKIKFMKYFNRVHFFDFIKAKIRLPVLTKSSGWQGKLCNSLVISLSLWRMENKSLRSTDRQDVSPSSFI